MQDSSLVTPLGQVPADLLTSPGNRFEDKVRAAQSASGDNQKAELKKVAQEFEAIFIAQMLKVMRETIEESGLMDGGFGKSVYTELFDQEVARSVARRGIGISDLLVRSLSSAQTPQEKESGPTRAIAPAPAPRPASPASPDNSAGSPDPDREISDLELPVQAPVSSAFGWRRDPLSHQVRLHKGLDLAAPAGMKVAAALPGTVVFAGYASGYGNTVLIRHAGGLETRYGHLGSVCVKAGDTVGSRDTLGTVGSTGKSTGPHLHFEVMRRGQPVDPLAGLNHRAAALPKRPQNPKMGG